MSNLDNTANRKLPAHGAKATLLTAEVTMHSFFPVIIIIHEGEYWEPCNRSEEDIDDCDVRVLSRLPPISWPVKRDSPSNEAYVLCCTGKNLPSH